MLFDIFAIAVILAIVMLLTYYLGIGRQVVDPRAETPEMWNKILVDCLLVGVEMCRADGHISEAELEALRGISTISNGVIPESKAEDAVSAAMKATIHRDGMRAAARRVRKRTPRDVRVRLLGFLRSVSLADGEWDEEEKKLLAWVCEVWGCEQPEILQSLGLSKV